MTDLKDTAGRLIDTPAAVDEVMADASAAAEAAAEVAATAEVAAAAAELAGVGVGVVGLRHGRAAAHRGVMARYHSTISGRRSRFHRLSRAISASISAISRGAPSVTRSSPRSVMK